jgi:arylsulfatase A-like enzyme
MVENLVRMLEHKGLLDNTYIFYTTDNGYHISQHRMHPGKECGFDTDIHIPLIVRGPGVAAGRTLDVVTAHTDLSPTILNLAGGHKDEFDGAPIPLHTDSCLEERAEHVNIEFWGQAFGEGIYGYRGSTYDGGYHGRNLYLNNTYKSVRLVGKDYNLYYSVWCSNAREFYNVQVSGYCSTKYKI